MVITINKKSLLMLLALLAVAYGVKKYGDYKYFQGARAFAEWYFNQHGNSVSDHSL